MERLGLALLTGRMNEFTAVTGVATQARRRFGLCNCREREMRRPRQKKIPLETQLGLLAMRFRSTRAESERDAVAAAYEHVVAQLIESGKWEEMPSLED